jgi:hypothetical protein
MSTALETATKIIPDLYYDLIARVIPGGALLATLSFAEASGPSLLYDAHREHGLWFLAFGGYLVGLFLTGASSVFFDLILSPAVGLFNRELAIAVGGTAHYNRLDAIARHNPDDGSRIWKMAAEKVCMENVLVASIVLHFAVTATPIGRQVQVLIPLVAGAAFVAWLLRVVSLHLRIKASTYPAPRGEA